MFEAYITNTALYPLMGIEVGTTVHFPMTPTGVAGRLAKSGIDGKRGTAKCFFTSFDSDVLGLYDHLYECENIDELSDWTTLCWKYGIRLGLKPLKPLLSWETTHRRERFDKPDAEPWPLPLLRIFLMMKGWAVCTPTSLGPSTYRSIQNYFDYEAYGRDVRINETQRIRSRWVCVGSPGGKEYYRDHRTFRLEHGYLPILKRPSLSTPFSLHSNGFKAPPAPKKDKRGLPMKER